MRKERSTLYLTNTLEELARYARALETTDSALLQRRVEGMQVTMHAMLDSSESVRHELLLIARDDRYPPLMLRSLLRLAAELENLPLYVQNALDGVYPQESE